jgi:hypothetical protein
MAEAESGLESPDALARLSDGLERLAEIVETGSKAEARTASNLAAAYAARCYARVRDRLARDAQIPEPELEHWFKVVLVFDQVRDALPPAAAELKINVVKALIERYYEGHSPEKKRAALEQLASLGRAR